VHDVLSATDLEIVEHQQVEVVLVAQHGSPEVVKIQKALQVLKS
jgi:hypothetical protein